MENSFAKKIAFLPVMFTLLLAAVTFGGMFRLYRMGGTAMEAATLSEKKKMSIAIDPERSYDANEIVSDQYQVFGSIYSKDGQMLYSPTVRSSGKAFYPLIGELNSGSSIYLASVYEEELTNDYSVWSGLKKTKQHDLTLTIDSTLQNQMNEYMTKHGIDGSLVTYDYETGEICCMVSTPAADVADMSSVESLPEGALLNKTLYTTIPGSTMKVVTMVLARNQGIDLENLYYNCEKTYQLSHGGTIICTGNHGYINGKTALGKSCNCYFAQMVENNLNLTQAKKDLKTMGFVMDNESKEASLGKLSCKNSSTEIHKSADFDTVWAFLGQGKTVVNPIAMCHIAGTIAKQQETIAPYLLQGEIKDGLKFEMTGADEFWESAYEGNYDQNRYGEWITAAKTGTAQLANGGEQKLLMGYAKDLHVSFYITFENYQSSDGEVLEVLPVDLANYLLEQMQETMI